MKPKAIVLLSGGLDSATALYYALSQGFDCRCLIFDYGQRHCRELEGAKRIAKIARCEYRVIKIDLPWKGSALLDTRLRVKRSSGIPNTYVPARNTIFLSFALSYAEAIGATAIFIGAHAQDYSGYPDCRPEFFRAFAQVIRTGTKEKRISVRAPLLNKHKSEIIRLGIRLGVPFAHTWSCYLGGKRPCGTCDSCRYRAKGFREAGARDPILEERSMKEEGRGRKGE